MNTDEIIKKLIEKQDLSYAKVRSSFFQTGKGQYSENDLFLGIHIDELKKFVKDNYKTFSLSDVEKLITNDAHELRTAGVLILVKKFKHNKKGVFDFYLKNINYINNWDLVDVSCWHIIGQYLFEINDFSLLYELASKNNLWENRIAIVSTLYFIKKGKFGVTFDIAKKYLNHPHHLIHKATGWMLREVGKQDKTALCTFLDEYKNLMPRTTLRYAIEKFGKEEKKFYIS